MSSSSTAIMQPIPTPPTDNLYKFKAIFGLWLLTLGLLIVGHSLQQVYLTKDGQDEFLSALAQYDRSADFIREADRRIASIEAGKSGENKLPGFGNFSSPESEADFLRNAVAQNRKIVERYQPDFDAVMDGSFFHSEKLRLIALLTEFAIGWALIVIGVVLMVGGFRPWRRIACLSEAMMAGQLEIVDLTKKKLRAEIEAIRRPSYRR